VRRRNSATDPSMGEKTRLVLELWAKRATVKEIAERLGVSSGTVRYYLKKMGLPAGRRRKVDEGKLKQIVEMRKSGAKIREIAERLSITRDAVRYYLRKAGLAGVRQRKVDEGKLRQMVELWHKNLTLKEIARQVGLSEYTVIERLHMMGLRRRRKCPRIGREELESLSRTLDDEEIAKMYSTSKICIRSLRRRYGILKRRRGVNWSVEAANKIVEALRERCYTTNRDLLKAGVLLDSRVLKALHELSSEVRRVKLEATSTSRYTVLHPRAYGMSILYLPGCEDEVAELIVSNMVNVNVPKATITNLLKNNGAPEELIDAVIRRVQLAKLNRSQ